MLKTQEDINISRYVEESILLLLNKHRINMNKIECYFLKKYIYYFYEGWWKKR